jgi:rod shape-determining protein MreC
MTIARTRPLFVLFLLVAVCLGLMVLHQLGFLASTERFLVQFVAPLQVGVSRIAKGAANLHIGLGNDERLRQQNEQLQTEVERLRSLVIGLKEAENENRVLREQLGFSQANPAYDLLPAQVIGRDPDGFVQTITIDKGTQDGVREGKVVVAAGTISMPTDLNTTAVPEDRMVVQGLVGRVIEAGPNYARVLLISDVSGAVNVMVQGSQADGLLVGQGSGRAQLTYVPQGEELAPGDILLTSGLGGQYPRSLAVGLVTDVQTKDQATFQTAGVAPLVDLRHLDVVFVIRSFDPIKIGS